MEPEIKSTHPNSPTEKMDDSATKPLKLDLINTKPVKVGGKINKSSMLQFVRSWLWIIPFILLIGTTVSGGAAAGIISGNQVRNKQTSYQTQLALQEQYELAIKDLEAENYDVALRRFEYILSEDPNFPGITDQMAIAMQVLYMTATPLPEVISNTPTPTLDPRPVEELFNQGLALITNQDWSAGIDTLINLRRTDLNYQVSRVDGLLYIALRNRGVQKIINEGNLEGGIYDLALANKFGPLDRDAEQAVEWARLYMIGLSFWEVDPQNAVYYFGQVAGAAPFLKDASGYTANERYRVALIQYGGQLAQKGDWCNAQTQYELALSIRGDQTLQTELEQVTAKCLGYTPTFGPGTGTISPTITITSPFLTPSPTWTQPIPPSITPTTEVVPPTTQAPPPTTQAPPVPSNTPEPPTETQSGDIQPPNP